VPPNSSIIERTSSIAVGGQTHSVRQEGWRPQGVRLKGRASGVSGSCPSLSFSVDGRSVLTDGNTRFDESCKDVRERVEVEVEGFTVPDGRVRAVRVKVEDDDDDD
jgi:hypothetical protein